jgi:hypothetical protein
MKKDFADEKRICNFAAPIETVRLKSEAGNVLNVIKRF